jgi:hypothetical protein
MAASTTHRKCGGMKWMAFKTPKPLLMDIGYCLYGQPWAVADCLMLLGLQFGSIWVEDSSNNTSHRILSNVKEIKIDNILFF